MTLNVPPIAVSRAETAAAPRLPLLEPLPLPTPASGAIGSTVPERALLLALNPRGVGVYPGEQTQMWVQGPLDPQSIHWNDVRQGTAGTCTILAAGMSLANSERGRLLLSRSLQDEGNGKISVTLWDRKMEIDLSRVKTMPARVGDFNGQRSDPRWEIWPKALEAGFARGVKWLFGVEFYRNEVIGSPDLHMALRAVSGKNHHVRDVAPMTPQQIYRDVGAALNDRKVIITGSVDKRAMSAHQQSLQRQHGLLPNHAYAVLGLNEANGTIWLGDPHGRSLSIPVADYLSFFQQIGWGDIP
jgi:hypothetical protein